MTFSANAFSAVENDRRGGRMDDRLRVADLNDALNDASTRAIVAVGGGAWFTRLLPDIDFASLARRRNPLWALGFSEMTSLVNFVATYRAGRGLYWLGPNYLAWKIKPADTARAAFAQFWETLPQIIGADADRQHAASDGAGANPRQPLIGRLVDGSARNGKIRIIGGCLSILAAFLPSRLGRRLRPDNAWLAIEDVNEAPYRIDRCLATLRNAGWFERIAGVLVGDFHSKGDDTQQATVEFLKTQLPPRRRIPIVTTRDFGHVWPMAPLPINRPVPMRVAADRVEINTA